MKYCSVSEQSVYAGLSSRSQLFRSFHRVVSQVWYLVLEELHLIFAKQIQQKNPIHLWQKGEKKSRDNAIFKTAPHFINVSLQTNGAKYKYVLNGVLVILL